MAVPSDWFQGCVALATGGAGKAAESVTLGLCAKLLVSKTLGFLIIAGSCIVKVPQIMKFVRAGEAKGVSVTMYILEALGYTITVAFNIRKGYPFSTFGENAFILVQNAVLIYLMFMYAKQLNAKFYAAVALYGAFFFALFFGGEQVVSGEVMALLQTSTIPLFTLSKIPQIVTSFRNKSTGQLAFVTCAMNFGGVLARAFTIFAEVPDPIIRWGVGIATVTNGIVVAQFALYWNARPAAAAAAAAVPVATADTDARPKSD